MRTTPLKVRLPLAAVYMFAATQLGAAVDTIIRLKDNDIHRQAYDDTVAKYEEDKLAYELLVERGHEYMRSREQFKENLEANRDEMEAKLREENSGVRITIAVPKVEPLESAYDLKIPQPPVEPSPYVAPPEPEARNYFLRHGHNLGVFLHQWAKDQQQPTPDPS